MSDEINGERMKLSAYEEEARAKVLADVGAKMKKNEPKPDEDMVLLAEYRVVVDAVTEAMRGVVAANGGVIGNRKAFLQLASQLYRERLRTFSREELGRLLALQSAAVLYGEIL